MAGEDYYAILGVTVAPPTTRSSVPTGTWPGSCTPTPRRCRSGGQRGAVQARKPCLRDPEGPRAPPPVRHVRRGRPGAAATPSRVSRRDGDISSVLRGHPFGARAPRSARPPRAKTSKPSSTSSSPRPSSAPRRKSPSGRHPVRDLLGHRLAPGHHGHHLHRLRGPGEVRRVRQSCLARWSPRALPALRRDGDEVPPRATIAGARAAHGRPVLHRRRTRRVDDGATLRLSGRARPPRGGPPATSTCTYAFGPTRP